MPVPHAVQLNIDAVNAIEAKQKAQLLQTIAENLETKNLEVLAKAAKKPGINGKIQQWKSFF